MHYANDNNFRSPIFGKEISFVYAAQEVAKLRPVQNKLATQKVNNLASFANAHVMLHDD